MEKFGPILDSDRVHFFSLQIGERSADVARCGFGDNLEDLSSMVRGFSATASVIDQLDLLISVNTALAHLAGAMGNKVWLLLSFVPDWCWLLERDDSPWYPTMRLFRQKERGDWGGVFEEVKKALDRFVR